MLIEKIYIEKCSLPKQEIISFNEMFVELHDEYLRYFFDFIASEPKSDDEIIGWEENKNYYDINFLKSSFLGVELYWHEYSGKWRVDLYLINFSQDSIRVFFKSKTKAEDFKTKILNWLINE